MHAYTHTRTYLKILLSPYSFRNYVLGLLLHTTLRRASPIGLPLPKQPCQFSYSMCACPSIELHKHTHTHTYAYAHAHAHMCMHSYMFHSIACHSVFKYTPYPSPSLFLSHGWPCAFLVISFVVLVGGRQKHKLNRMVTSCTLLLLSRYLSLSLTLSLCVLLQN